MVPGLRVPRELTMWPGQDSGWSRGLWQASLQGSVPPEELKSLPEAHGPPQGLRFLTSKTICSSVEMRLTLRFIATSWLPSSGRFLFSLLGFCVESREAKEGRVTVVGV